VRECGKLDNDKLHNLYGSPHVIRVIIPGRMKWAGCVARTRRWKYYKVKLVNLGDFGDVGQDESLKIKWVLNGVW